MPHMEIFKGQKAVRLENDALKVLVLPSIGGKIASLYHKPKQFELLFQNREQTYRKAKLYDPFEKFDASGFDDAFPTVDRCEIEVNGQKVTYPDHGEVWSMPHRYEICRDSVILFAQSAILPYKYKKAVRLCENKLSCEYEIDNTGSVDFPCLWTMHCLINCREDMRILFPKGTAEILNGMDSAALGKKGTIHPFPVTKLPDGREYRLDHVLPAGSGTCEKYYVNGKVSAGLAGAYFPDQDISFLIHYDKEKLPYLGFWVTQGKFRGDYNCALEPSNGFYDSVETAADGNSAYILRKGEKLRFTVTMELR